MPHRALRVPAAPRPETTVDLFAAPTLDGADAGRFEVTLLAAHSVDGPRLDGVRAPDLVRVQGWEWQPGLFEMVDRGYRTPVDCEVPAARFWGSLLGGPYALRLTGPFTVDIRDTVRLLYTATWNAPHGILP